ncbi:MAG: hypothetical protein IJX05_02500 [Clostridia bacterium]|nr:hypothetical protein [Clostridia bacterium]
MLRDYAPKCSYLRECCYNETAPTSRKNKKTRRKDLKEQSDGQDNERAKRAVNNRLIIALSMLRKR